MKAKFVGKDKSLGFRNGQVYTIRTTVINNWLWVFTTGNMRSKPKRCPYGSLEKMLENWKLLEETQEIGKQAVRANPPCIEISIESKNDLVAKRVMEQISEHILKDLNSGRLKE